MNLEDLIERLSKEAYGSDLEQLLLEAADALERYHRVFNEDAVLTLAAQALGLEPDRLRELSQADQAIGREIFLPNDKVRGTVEGFRAWKDGSISFSLVDGRHRYSLSSDLVYKFLPNRGHGAKTTMRRQLPGAVFTACGWLLISFFFSVYLDIFTGFSNMYGGMTTLILILLWLYVCMYIILLGGEINAILEGYGYTGKRRVDKLKTYDKMKK